MIKISINLVTLYLIFGIINPLAAQQRFWISFIDKDQTIDELAVSATTLSYRKSQNLQLFQQSDLSVKQHYIDSLKDMGITIFHQSKWLNAVSADIGVCQISALEKLRFVAEIKPVSSRIRVLRTNRGGGPDYTSVLDQINAREIYHKGLDGKGISIGIIDVGYFGAKINGSLRPIFNDERVLGFKDFINNKNINPFGNLQSFSHSHGTTVWKLVGGFNRSTNVQHGLATGASYYLARTDNTKYEFRAEEDYWIAAIEWMDSLGVRLVNTSLGYSIGFDDPQENYSPDDMDGHTTNISKAAQIAADDKGMLLVVAAGNEGHDPNWQVVSAPADTKGVISVGATAYNTTAKIRYSAIGPGFLPYLKPNITCYSSNGTSFSAPVVTGIAACIMQMDPTLNNYQVKAIIERSGNIYPYGNNYVGYGVPDCGRVLKLISDIDHNFHRTKKVMTDTSIFDLVIDSKIEERIVLFHKQSEFEVIEQKEVIHQGNSLSITRPENAAFTTVVLKDKVIELIWP